MSHIFDALVRSKSEEPNSGEIAPKVTDVLEQAERLATAQREAADATNAGETAAVSAAQAAATQDNERLYSALPQGGLAGAQQARHQQAVPDGLQVVNISVPEDSRLVSFSDPKSPAAEAFRLLGVRIRHLRRERPLGKLLITSTLPQEGKSMVAANLACSLAGEAGRRVLLLDGDLRRPAAERTLGVTVKSGLSEYLQNTCDLKDCIYRVEKPEFWLLPAGEIPDHPLELLQSSAMPPLMETIESMFDWVIIDAPPFLPLADASIWERFADGVLLVARRGITRRRKLEKGLDAIDDSKIVCALINSSSAETSSDYHYYYQRDEG